MTIDAQIKVPLQAGARNHQTKLLTQQHKHDDHHKKIVLMNKPDFVYNIIFKIKRKCAHTKLMTYGTSVQYNAQQHFLRRKKSYRVEQDFLEISKLLW
jgi:hypothetical protein